MGPDVLSKLFFFQNPWLLILIIIVFAGTIYCCYQALKCDNG